MKVLILGGGLSGLSCGWKLAEKGHEVHVVEKESELGGISSSFEYDGFILDYGPHKIYTQMPHIGREIKTLLGSNLINIPKKSQIYLRKRLYNFPVEIKEVLLNLPASLSFKSGIDYMLATIRRSKNDQTYENYLVNRFGRTLYELVFLGYARKIWGNPKLLSSDLAKTRVSMPSLLKMLIHSISGGKGRQDISADSFQYPKSGGILELCLAMEDRILKNGGKIHFNTQPTQIRVSKNRVSSVRLSNNTTIKPDFVASTVPVDDLAKLIYPQNSRLVSVSKKLKYKSIILLYLMINRERVLKSNWVFFPEQRFVFNRISEQKQFSDFQLPTNKSVITVEVTCDREDKKWKLSDTELLELSMGDLEAAGVVSRSEVKKYFSRRLVDAYPIYSLDYKNNLDAINKQIDNIGNLISYGRKGLFNYNNMDHCIDMGIIAADHIDSREPKEKWIVRRQKFNKYKIVD